MEYLNMIRSWLMECNREIVKVEARNPGKRMIPDMKYPKGYEV